MEPTVTVVLAGAVPSIITLVVSALLGRSVRGLDSAIAELRADVKPMVTDLAVLKQELAQLGTKVADHHTRIHQMEVDSLVSDDPPTRRNRRR